MPTQSILIEVPLRRQESIELELSAQLNLARFSLELTELDCLNTAGQFQVVELAAKALVLIAQALARRLVARDGREKLVEHASLLLEEQLLGVNTFEYERGVVAFSVAASTNPGFR